MEGSRSEYRLVSGSFSTNSSGRREFSTPLLVVGLCYLIITIPLSNLARRLECQFGSAGMPKGAEV
jgi:ABC-type amino acid transport system permease subunit